MTKQYNVNLVNIHCTNIFTEKCCLPNENVEEFYLGLIL